MKRFLLYFIFIAIFITIMRSPIVLAAENWVKFAESEKTVYLYDKNSVVILGDDTDKQLDFNMKSIYKDKGGEWVVIHYLVKEKDLLYMRKDQWFFSPQGELYNILDDTSLYWKATTEKTPLGYIAKRLFNEYQAKEKSQSTNESILFKQERQSTGEKIKGHFATKDDLIGYWKRIRYPEHVRVKLNKVEPWPSPYHWFAFYEDDHFMSYMSTTYRALSGQDLEKMFSALPKNIKYQFRDGFIKITYSDIKGYSEYWGVNVIEETADVDGVHYEKGDILMSLSDPQSGKPIYYRLLRRLPN